MSTDTAEEIWSAAFAQAEPAFDEMRRAAGESWPAWGLRMMPPVPAAWPPGGSGTLVFYAGAARSGMPELMDGEVVAHMWARIMVDATPGAQPAATLERLTDAIVEEGIQGIRPMNEQEVAVADTAPHVLEALVRIVRGTGLPPESPQTEAVRAYYRQALGFLGGFGRIVCEDHPAFAAWVGDTL